MHLVMIRHGEQDYTLTESRGWRGPARELAPLTQRGITQAEAVEKDLRLQGCQLIISSPYTRALQTAAIISHHVGLPIEVAFGLHEWLVDTKYQNRDITDAIAAAQEASLF